MNISDKLVSVIIVTYNRKNDIVQCVNSLLDSSYQEKELIIVDNASLDATVAELKLKFKDKINLIENKHNVFAAAGRNLGAKNAKGKYLLFVDSDNVVAPDMLSELVINMQKNEKNGLIGPFTYYRSSPGMLCWVNNRINLLTSITSFQGAGIDRHQYDNIESIGVGHIPNAFMLKAELFKRVGGFDEEYVMHYEESDLAQKIKKLGYNIALIPKAKIWHNVNLGTTLAHKSFLNNDYKMVYYVSRNRIYFMWKSAPLINLIIFLFIFSHLFLLFNLLILLLNRKFKLMKYALKGHTDGLFYPLLKKTSLI